MRCLLLYRYAHTALSALCLNFYRSSDAVCIVYGVFLFLFEIAMCRTEAEQCNADEQRRRRQTYRVDRHNGSEGRILRKYKVYPEYAYTAYADGRENGGYERDSEAAHIAGEHLVQHTEYICGEEIDQAGVAYLDDLGIAVEDRQQEAPRQQDYSDGNR